MKDRIPAHPGRIQLIPVPGQDGYFDVVRADDPTQAGTPLNKTTLLKDQTAEAIGLTADAVPDDALAALQKKKSETTHTHDASKIVSGIIPIERGGTGSSTGNAPSASTATKLTNSRDFLVNLASTSKASFNGTANATMGVSGTLPVAHGGTGKSSFTTNRLLYASGSSTLNQIAPPSVSGSVLAQAGGAPYWRNDICTIGDAVALLTPAGAPLQITLSGTLEKNYNDPNWVVYGDYAILNMDLSALPANFYGAYFGANSTQSGSSNAAAQHAYAIIDGVTYDLGINDAPTYAGTHQQQLQFNSWTKFGFIISKAKTKTIKFKWVRISNEHERYSYMFETLQIYGFIKKGMA